MLVYQVRERVVRLVGEDRPTFPADGLIRLHLLPEQPFGESPNGGRTVVRGHGGTVTFNANSGRHTVASKSPLAPLSVPIKESTRTVKLSGRVLEVRERFEIAEHLTRTIEALYFGLPWLLNVKFRDPPYVERVDGEIDGIPFRWELRDWTFEVGPTTQEEQEKAVVASWLRFDVLSTSGRRRLAAALHYFHVACRLERAGETPGEFLSEVLLNLCKCLEVLFPGPEGGTQDAVREGLRTVGVPAEEIERRFVPVLILRNQIDVGHVHLSVFTSDQLKVLHSFLESVEQHFRALLDRVLDKVAAGEWQPEPYEDLKPAPKAVKTIERMAQALQE